MDAIIYTSNTGSTAYYAKALALETGLPAYSMAEADNKVQKGAKIIYLGWLMAGAVQGYAAAAKQYDICGVCAVGMGRCGTQTEEVRRKNHIPKNIPLFTLQGNFDIKKLHGIYRFMMNIMVKTAGKALAEKQEKQDRTADEEDMLDMMQNGSGRVKTENLRPVLEWYEQLK